MRRGITQEAFAEEIDISISYYQKLNVAQEAVLWIFWFSLQSTFM